MHWWRPEVSVGEKILRSLIVYFFLLIMFRLIGRREVAQMTVFDLVVLLILSNVLQNGMIGPDNSVTGGLIGAVAILAINWAVGRAAFSNRWFERAVEACLCCWSMVAAWWSKTSGGPTSARRSCCLIFVPKASLQSTMCVRLYPSRPAD